MIIKSIRGRIGSIKWRFLQLARSALYRAPMDMNKQFVSEFWENQAKMIHEKWGEGKHDYEILGKILSAYRPGSILDVGCGSGRLFDLFIQNNIQDVIGVDISAEALSIAHKQYPQIMTLQCRLEDLEFPPGRFGLIVSNRVLQHLPPHAIAYTVAKLCLLSPLIYVNELTESDNEPENFYMFRHDYSSLFAKYGFTLIEKGLLGHQTYQLFERN